MFNTWLHFWSQTNLFPNEFCKQSSIKIFNVYLQCHLSAPEGTRSPEEKDLNKEKVEFEEDDTVRFKKQLQTIGKYYIYVLSYIIFSAVLLKISYF